MEINGTKGTGWQTYATLPADCRTSSTRIFAPALVINADTGYPIGVASARINSTGTIDVCAESNGFIVLTLLFAAI